MKSTIILKPYASKLTYLQKLSKSALCLFLGKDTLSYVICNLFLFSPVSSHLVGGHLWLLISENKKERSYWLLRKCTE